MRPVSPNVGWYEVRIGTDQLEYKELVGAVIPFDDGSTGILMRWRLTEEEKARVMAGDDLYVTLLTFGRPMQPIDISIGRPEYLP